MCVCELCGDRFESEWTEEEALEEAKRAGFTFTSEDPKITVCDDCYQKVMAVHASRQ